MRWLFLAHYKICQSLLLFFTLCFVTLSSEAQTGVITGRVVSEDGSGLPGMTVTLLPVATDRRARTGGSQKQTSTDLDGNFKFTGLAPRVYSVSASAAKSYVPRPVKVSERQDGGYYRVGDNAIITMIKGGAITGRVTNATGETLIDVQVNAAMAPDAEGNPARLAQGGRQRFTDDRGIYRIYGLPPGTYVVFTRNAFFHLLSPYDGDAPTYHPSSTRETAAEVTVASGGETVGVDIRYRGDRGRAVSGSVSGGEPFSPYTEVIIELTNTVTGAVQSDANFIRTADGSPGFAIYGVTDGEYEIIARRVGHPNEELMASSPRRVVVRGADVGGIELKLLSMGSIAGKFTLEAAPTVCESKRKWLLGEALLVLRHEAKPEDGPRRQPVVNGLTEKGEFTVYNLEANRYFLEPRLPNENWYVKAITAPASTSASTNTSGAAARRALSADISRNGIMLKAGEKITGVVATIADGAAGLSGKVIPPTDGSRLPARLRIHLIPAEARAADEVLRYAEAYARSDGSFSLSNIAPGKYWLVARAVPDDEPINRPPFPAAWGANERAKLRREAEMLKIEVELKPCQRITDHVVKY